MNPNKKILLYLLFCLVALTSFSQVLIDTTKTWNVLERNITMKTKCYKFQHDTVLGGFKYKILSYSYSEHFDTNKSQIAGFLREDEKRVAIRYQNGEQYLLYDFSLVQGDTVDLGFLNGEINLMLKVDTITYARIDTLDRKVLHMVPLDASLTIPQLWIEGMGSTHGIIDVGRKQIFGNESALLCFSDCIRDTVLWKSTLDICYYSNNPAGRVVVFEAAPEKQAKEKKASKNEKGDLKSDVEVKQNSTEEIVLQANLQNSGLKLKIYNENGDLVQSRTIKKEKDLKFSDLKSGTYLIQITDSFEKIYATKKITI